MTEPASADGPQFTWTRVADDLRDRIQQPDRDDYLPAGFELPAVAALATEYAPKLGRTKIGTPTIEKALRSLTVEGLVIQPGRGYRYTVRNIHRFPVDTAFTPERWAQAVQADGHSPSSRWLQMKTVFPYQHLMSVLGIPPDNVLFSRSTLYLVDSRPVMLMESLYPHSVAMQATVLVQPKQIHGDELTAAGRREDTVLDRIINRGPTQPETRTLGLTGLASPVIEWTRYGFERDPDTGRLTWIRAVIAVLRGDACELQVSPADGSDVAAQLRAGILQQ